nr:ABC transporter substrate-binding protein [Prevotella sp.]
MKSNHLLAWLAFLLAVGQVLLILASWLLTAAMPDSFSRSLLSAGGIRWFFGRFVDNIESPLLVWLLLLSFVYGVVDHSGILHYKASEYRQRIAMRLALFEGIFFILLMLALVMAPHAILLNVMGGLFPSSFSASLVPYCCFSLMVMSVSYGVMSDRMKNVVSVYEAIVSGTGKSGGLLLIYVIGAQLYHSIIFLFSA